MPSKPSVSDWRERVRDWLHREPKPDVARTILIVDSDAAIRESTSKVIQSLGFEALPVPNLAEALAQLEVQDPEWVLLGFDLDDGDGLDALKQIREADPDVPVVMLADTLWDTRVAEAMRLGAIAYLPRPFGPDDVRELVGRQR